MSTWLDDLHANQRIGNAENNANRQMTLREWCDSHDVSDGYVHCLTKHAMAELLRIADNQEREVAEFYMDLCNLAHKCLKSEREVEALTAFAKDLLDLADDLFRLDGTRSELKRMHKRARELGIEVDE